MISTIIFDMNGVISNDEHLHEQAFKKTLGEIGSILTSEVYEELFLGRTDKAGFEDFMDRFKIDNNILDTLLAQKSKIYLDLIDKENIAYPGVVSFIKTLSDKYTLALTTGSTYEETDMILSKLSIKDLFSVIVSADDVQKSKPDPEPYILTAKKLKANSSECLVIEDSHNGIASAKSAGMKCVAITNTEKESNLTNADYIVNDYKSIINHLN